jgi:uncharacterized protein with HEPN domain
MRDRLTHGYFGVDLLLVCRVVERESARVENGRHGLIERDGKIEWLKPEDLGF